MWAQLITMTLKPEHEGDLESLFDQLAASETPGSGHVRTVAMRSQADPNTIHTLVMFESEEQARARENDPARQELLAPIRAQMGRMFEGPPQFLDLDVIRGG